MMLVTYAFEKSAPLPRPYRWVLPSIHPYQVVERKPADRNQQASGVELPDKSAVRPSSHPLCFALMSLTRLATHDSSWRLLRVWGP